VKRPSIHQLEVFCRVVQLESMARAAEELRVTPSSVSMQIQELEKRFKAPLLVRGPRRTVPTAAGDVLYTQAIALLEGLDSVERELSRLGALESGVLRFATSRTIGAGPVRLVLQPFERAHPQVDVSYHVMASSQQAKTEVMAERAEFALVGRVGPDWPLDVRPLFEEPLVVVMAPDHPLAAEDRPCTRSLDPHVLLLREPPVLGHARVLRLLEEADAHPTVVELGSTEAVKAEAVAGHGVAVLPRTTVADEITTGDLVTRDLEGFHPNRTIFLTSLSKTPLSPVARSFVQLVRQTCNEPAGTSAAAADIRSS
jgi:DNA-binding transcriptional LysR family regulator